ncbi:MAG: antibiotic biosynthesis monooxygenase [Chitinophaga sp.]|uniref:putative quinol monooxygenase n=1 Tax=Chitinophaga sp. TaxID=1869181 RepID=UPI0025BD7871|nr:putative quinol monooxygenase [Chitinophaga sp.]MBV8251293.1 antibiotic biosynthesis monooxygenase [Chitinophaga sp.]
MKVYLTAIIKSKPEYQEAVKTQLLQMVQQSRQEAACLQYDLHQENTDENIFTFHEIWENAEGLAQHDQQPYIQSFVGIIPVMLQEPPVIYRGKLL